jgi:hypothetical protein
MKIILILAMFCFAFTQSVSDEKRLPANAKVFINPIEGFETYLIAAFEKKKVPILVVTDKEKADFEITGTATEKKAGTAKIIFGSGRSEVDASIQITNIKTGVVVFGSSSHKGDAWRGKRSAAEAIAKAIKSKIEKDGK